MVLGQVALEAAVIDPEEAPVAQARHAAAEGVAEARRWPVEQARAGLPQPVRQVDVLEPGGMEALVEAAGGQERLAAERQRRRRRLLDRRAGRRLGGEAAGGAGSAGERPGKGLAQAAPGRGEAAQLPGELRFAVGAGEAGSQAGGLRMRGEACEQLLERAGLGQGVGV